MYLRWLWWRHTWTFQAAHKPLCARFHREVLRVGPVRVCRSCTALYGGFVLMATVLAFAGPGRALLPGTIPACAAALVAGFSAPAIYRHAPRGLRDILRAATGVLAAQCLFALASPAWAGGLAVLTIFTGAWLVYQRERRGHTARHDACAGCPECATSGICSGYRYQAAHLRSYEEAATVWLEKNAAPAIRFTTPPRA